MVCFKGNGYILMYYSCERDHRSEKSCFLPSMLTDNRFINTFVQGNGGEFFERTGLVLSLALGIKIIIECICCTRWFLWENFNVLLTSSKNLKICNVFLRLKRKLEKMLFFHIKIKKYFKKHFYPYFSFNYCAFVWITTSVLWIFNDLLWLCQQSWLSRHW